MNKMVLGPVGTLFLFAVLMANHAFAAELLDVKPIISGSNVVIEVTADIPMTYTYYKVPGQARAVVDIADADPEKVEPLIVVNKGVLSSISVDKAMIADMTVSRLVFNLVSESDITVKQEADRKKITVSFSAGNSVAVAEPPPADSPAPVAAPVAVPEPMTPEVLIAIPVNPLSKEEEEEDPLGLDEPMPVTATAPVVDSSVALDPVVPATTAPSSSKAVVVKGIVIGSSFIDIQADGTVEKIKHMKLIQPDRLAIDIPAISTMTVKSIPVNKFGIAKVRIGSTPGVVRIVLDATRSPFPFYSVYSMENGVRINFK
ncbi:MAG: AMIN domain-containing protein [Verrucomicrobia bacterium]|nr:AMIN domain-containing protein [Deltaproteobacteria bacterium]